MIFPRPWRNPRSCKRITSPNTPWSWGKTTGLRPFRSFKRTENGSSTRRQASTRWSIVALGKMSWQRSRPAGPMAPNWSSPSWIGYHAMPTSCLGWRRPAWTLWRLICQRLTVWMLAMVADEERRMTPMRRRADAANLWHKATHFRCSPKATVSPPKCVASLRATSGYWRSLR